jgi:hypothetical protein
MITRKVLAQAITSALLLAASWFTTRYGIHLNAGVSAELSAGIGVLAGALAGVLAKEVPAVVSDLSAPPAVAQTPPAAASPDALAPVLGDVTPSYATTDDSANTAPSSDEMASSPETVAQG